MTRLKDAVENRAYPNPLAQTRARTWLVHWSLFVFFNHENGPRTRIIDLFFQERYMQSIQAEAPHLLRYLAAAVITNKRRRSMLATWFACCGT